MRNGFSRLSILRLARIESLEPRMMMSASPHNGGPDFVLDYFPDVLAQRNQLRDSAFLAMLTRRRSRRCRSRRRTRRRGSRPRDLTTVSVGEVKQLP